MFLNLLFIFSKYIPKLNFNKSKYLIAITTTAIYLGCCEAPVAPRLTKSIQNKTSKPSDVHHHTLFHITRNVECYRKCYEIVQPMCHRRHHQRKNSKNFSCFLHINGPLKSLVKSNPLIRAWNAFKNFSIVNL